MSIFGSIIPAVFVLGILILIHEFGHFLACRFSGVKVEKFSIGFGPEILSWQGNQTRYSISLFPLGGFVKPAGEAISEVESESGPQKGDYLAAPIYSRIFIVVAGVAMNYILAFVLFTAIYLIGHPVLGTTLGGFMDGYPAKESGLREMDKITQINGQDVVTWVDLTNALDKSPEGAVELVFEREGQIQSVQISPKVEDVRDMFGKTHKVKRLGVTPHPEAQHFEKYGLKKALGESWDTVTFLTIMTHKAIFYMVTGRVSMKNISGPIGIITMTGTAVKLGLPYLLHLTAVLSISLAVINLLPIPALDGGHLLFLLIEAVRRKRVSLVFQERATQVGFFVLLTLMAVVIFNDLAKLDVFNQIKGFVSGILNH